MCGDGYGHLRDGKTPAASEYNAFSAVDGNGHFLIFLTQTRMGFILFLFRNSCVDDKEGSSK